MKVSEMTNEELLNRFSNESVVIAASLTDDKPIPQDYRNSLRTELLRRLNAEPVSRPYEIGLAERLKDPEYAAAYAKAVAEDAEPGKPRYPKCGRSDRIEPSTQAEHQYFCVWCGQFFPAERQEGWVSVKDRLPKESDNGQWLFLATPGGPRAGIWGKANGQWGFCNYETGWHFTVTHWKEAALPAPPSVTAEPIAQKGLMAMQKNPLDKPVSNDV